MSREFADSLNADDPLRADLVALVDTYAHRYRRVVPPEWFTKQSRDRRLLSRRVFGYPVGL